MDSGGIAAGLIFGGWILGVAAWKAWGEERWDKFLKERNR
jgi:hypothetical protein